MDQVMTGQPMTVFGDGLQTRAFTHVDDVAPIIARSPLVPDAARGTFNIGAETPYTVLQLATEVAKALAGPCRVKHLPARSEVVHAFSDHSRLHEVFGNSPPIDLATGIQQHLAHGRDLVHCWQEPYVIAGGQVAALTPKGVPIVYASFQNLPKAYPPPFAQIERWTIRRASGCVAFGHTVAANLSARSPYRSKSVRVLPIGVDVEHFRLCREGGPVVGSDLGEIPYTVGDAGIIVGERDSRAWTLAIEQLLGSAEHRRELSQRGLERAHLRYDWPVVDRLHLDFFNELLEGR
jgi:glycosyltransferase involved in cell wall biosynthesis